MKVFRRAVAFLCLASVSLSQTGTVQGTVTLPDTSSWGGIVVTILGQNRFALTQPNGQFTLSNVASGAISVQAGKLYYANARKDTTLAPGGTLTLSLNLGNILVDTLVPQQTASFLTGVTNEGNIGALNHFVEPADPGFTWGGQQQLFEASLMVSVDSTRVSDAARFILGIAQDNLDHDFQSLSDVVVLTLGQDSTVLVTAYDDSRSNIPPGIPSQPLGIRVTQQTYSFDQPQEDGFLIVKLTLRNTTTVTLTNMVVGWFVDWDVQPSFGANRGGVMFVQNYISGPDSFETEIVYERNSSAATYVGLIPLSQPKFKASRIASNVREIFVDSTNRYAGLTEANKYRYMMSRRDTNRYSDWGAEEDLSMIVSAGGSGSPTPDSSTFTLAGGDSVVVAFAFVGGSDSASFVQNALSAQRKWFDLNVIVTTPFGKVDVPQTLLLEQNYPNPFNPTTVVKYALPKASFVSLKVFNILGQEVITLVNGDQAAGYLTATWDGRNSRGFTVSTGLYFYRIEAKPTDGSDAFIQVKKMLFLK